MRKTILLFMACSFFMACSNDDNPCENIADNPLEEYEWLQEVKNNMTDCLFETSIIQGTYLRQTVFFTAVTDPLFSGINTPTLYNCQGGIVRIFTMDNYQDYQNQVTINKVLYRCKDEAH